jgi:nucleotide-binding universal stress UspA family protein
MAAPYARIACFIDDDPASDLAVAEAVALRALSPGELYLVHVAARPLPLFVGMYGSMPPPGDYSVEAEAWLRERARQVPEATAWLLQGWPPRAACEFVIEHGIDLLVAAAHRGVVERAMLGGFAAYVAYHAPCSVLLVHPPVPAPEAEGSAAADEGEGGPKGALGREVGREG